jgi:Spy/CpxP family protein refolding chaperone
MNMNYKFRHLLPSLAVLGLVGAAAVATPPAFAADTTTASDKAAAQKPIDRADERIKQLHDSLKITPDQEAKFDKLADVMRDNAKEMSAAVEKRSAAEKTTTALDDLKAYQTIAQAHADGLKNLVPAFETLYSALSDPQKKEADELFIHGPGEGKHGHKS